MLCDEAVIETMLVLLYYCWADVVTADAPPSFPIADTYQILLKNLLH